MIQQLDLTEYNYVFSGNNLELSKKNFIYGRNGTGKSSITDAIKKQYSDTHNICIFNGYQNIFKENDSLDTFSLGEEKGKQNEELNNIEQQIEKLNNELLLNNENKDNLFSKLEKANTILEKREKEIDKVAIQSAGIIKKVSEPRISISSYDKRDFHSEIQFANTISDEEIKKQESIILSKKTERVEKIDIKDISLERLIQEVNDVLEKELKPSTILKELEENNEKQQFARTGLKIHKHIDSDGVVIYDEKCAFCNGEITDNRIQQLDSYFSEAVETLEKKINTLKSVVNSKKEDLGIYQEVINNEEFHDTFRKELFEIKNEIFSKVSSGLRILEKIEKLLVIKQNSIFEKQEKFVNIKDISFKKERERIEEIVEKNNALIENIENEKEKAREIIRFDKIANLLKKKGYEELKNEKLIAKVKYDQLREDYEIKKDILENLKEDKRKLISQFDTEMDVVDNINELLEGLGNQSIRLDMVKNDVKNKGSYWIKGYDGERRPLQKLSEGEKNLIAFLYFMYKLKDVNSSDQEKIVLFDDPVTSNDSTTQYLIIGVLKTFYAQQDCPQFIILSHNQHFFIQVLPNKISKHKVYHLQKSANSLVNNKEIAHTNQLGTLYSELWTELAYAYKKEESTFMWNVMRRILESFVKFYYNYESVSELDKLITDPKGKSLMTALIKSLHVNSHLAFEFQMDIRAHTPTELLKAFEDIFEMLELEKHYKIYWKLAIQSTN